MAGLNRIQNHGNKREVKMKISKEEIFTDFSSAYEDFEESIHHFRAVQIIDFFNIISEPIIIITAIALCFSENISLEALILLVSVIIFSILRFCNTIKLQKILRENFKITVSKFDSMSKILIYWCHHACIDLSYFSVIKLLLELQNDSFYEFRFIYGFSKLIIHDILIFFLNIIYLTVCNFLLNYRYSPEGQILILIELLVLASSYLVTNYRHKRYDNKNVRLRNNFENLIRKLSKEFPDKKALYINTSTENEGNSSISVDCEDNTEGRNDESSNEMADEEVSRQKKNGETLVLKLKNSNETFSGPNDEERSLSENTDQEIEKNLRNENMMENSASDCVKDNQSVGEDGSDRTVHNEEKNAILNNKFYHQSYNENENTESISENTHSGEKQPLLKSNSNLHVFGDYEQNTMEGQNDGSLEEMKNEDNLTQESNDHTLNLENKNSNGNYSLLKYHEISVFDNVKAENVRITCNEDTIEQLDSVNIGNNKCDAENKESLPEVPHGDITSRSMEHHTVFDNDYYQNSNQENENATTSSENSYDNEQKTLGEQLQNNYISVDGKGNTVVQKDGSIIEMMNEGNVLHKYNKHTLDAKLNETISNDASSVSDNTELENERNKYKENTTEEPDSVIIESNNNNNAEKIESVVKYLDGITASQSIDQNIVLDDYCYPSNNKSNNVSPLSENSYGDEQESLPELQKCNYIFKEINITEENDSVEAMNNEEILSQECNGCTLDLGLRESDEKLSRFNDNERSGTELENNRNTCIESIEKLNFVIENNESAKNTDSVVKAPHGDCTSLSIPQSTVFDYKDFNHFFNKTDTAVVSSENTQTTLKEDNRFDSDNTEPALECDKSTDNEIVVHGISGDLTRMVLTPKFTFNENHKTIGMSVEDLRYVFENIELGCNKIVYNENKRKRSLSCPEMIIEHLPELRKSKETFRVLNDDEISKETDLEKERNTYNTSTGVKLDSVHKERNTNDLEENEFVEEASHRDNNSQNVVQMNRNNDDSSHNENENTTMVSKNNYENTSQNIIQMSRNHGDSSHNENENREIESENNFESNCDSFTTENKKINDFVFAPIQNMLENEFDIDPKTFPGCFNTDLKSLKHANSTISGEEIVKDEKIQHTELKLNGDTGVCGTKYKVSSNIYASTVSEQIEQNLKELKFNKDFKVNSESVCIKYIKDQQEDHYVKKSSQNNLFQVQTDKNPHGSQEAFDHVKGIKVTQKTVPVSSQTEEETHEDCVRRESNYHGNQKERKSRFEAENREQNSCSKGKNNNIKLSSTRFYEIWTDPVQMKSKSDEYNKETVISKFRSYSYNGTDIYNLSSSTNPEVLLNSCSLEVLYNGQLEDALESETKYVNSKKEDNESTVKNEYNRTRQASIAQISNTQTINICKDSKLDSEIPTGNDFHNEEMSSLNKSDGTETNEGRTRHYHVMDGVRRKVKPHDLNRITDSDASRELKDKKFKKNKKKSLKKEIKREIYHSECTSVTPPRKFDNNYETINRDYLTQSSCFPLQKSVGDVSPKGVITLSKNNFKVDIHTLDDIGFDYYSSFATTTEGNLKEEHHLRFQKWKKKK